MKMNRTFRPITMFAAVLAWFLFMAGSALAHCDTMDGPVVRAAKQALTTRNINYVLIWVEPKDEAEIRQAFRQTLIVRRLNRSARALADRYFFETLVRIHRAGEGQPYTGLTDGEPEPIIAAADRALELGSADELEDQLVMAVKSGLTERF